MSRKSTLRLVAICDHCFGAFIPGESGEGYFCDKCRDILLHNGAWSHPFQPIEKPPETTA